MARRVSAAKRDYATPLQQPAAVKTTAVAAKPPINHGPPDKFTYALEAWSAERRKDGWYVAPTAPRAGMAMRWNGPFLDIEKAMLSIARGLCHELGDRHSRHIERYQLTPKDPRYGLKPSTVLKPAKSKTVA